MKEDQKWKSGLSVANEVQVTLGRSEIDRTKICGSSLRRFSWLLVDNLTSLVAVKDIVIYQLVFTDILVAKKRRKKKILKYQDKVNVNQHYFHHNLLN